MRYKVSGSAEMTDMSLVRARGVSRRLGASPSLSMVRESSVAAAKQAVADRVELLPGYSVAWSGQYEQWERAKERLWLVVPLTLAFILVLLYLNFRTLTGMLIILATLPLALVGGFGLMYLLGYHLSVASAIGFIALGGVVVEIGVVMMLYLDRALARRREVRGAAGLTPEDVKAAVVEGALLRLRPVTMTKAAIVAALLPILLRNGAGSEVMRRIAAPMVGGMVSVALLTLAVIPAVYLVWKSRVIATARRNSVSGEPLPREPEEG